MKKKTFPWLTFAITGTGIGFPIMLLCMTLLGGFNEIISELLTWMIASALFGVISGLVFYKDNLNLPVATAIHCVCCLVVAAAAGTICGYADSFLAVLTGVLPVFAMVYVLIYGFCFLAMKQEEKKVNEALNKE